MLPSKESFQLYGHTWTESERMEEDIQCNQQPKESRAGLVIFISDKIDFNSKKITRDKDGHWLKVKGSIHQEDIIILNMYAVNIGALKCIKQILMDIKEEIGNNTIVGDFNNG